MSNKVAVLGVNDNAICFDYDQKIVYFFRKGWASKTLKLVDIASPFDKITAIELIKPTFQQSGRIALIVEGNRLLAEDQFENNASELSIGENMYAPLLDAVTRLIQEYPSVQLVTDGQLNVPKTKNQKSYATAMTYAAFAADGIPKANVTKTNGISVGALLLVLIIGLACIYFLFRSLM